MKTVGEMACRDCLARCWLVGRLNPLIATVCDDRPGRRTPELLALPDLDLVRAVVPGQLDEIATWLAGLDEGEMRSALEAAGCWAVCRHSEHFPAGLEDGRDAPPLLTGRGDFGLLDRLNPDGCVTVVGARRATGYGLEAAATLGRELAGAGLTVISGLAIGVDGAVHRGALERGRTVAVLGCGPDRIYPTTHRRLYRQIVERGLVLSEQPPGTGVRRWCFPARNRIMAALAGMTVVVEARRRSGSLITANMAGDLGREVGAVPGPVGSSTSSGTNHLIASGAALIRDGQDVLDRLLGVGVARLSVTGPDPGPAGRTVLDGIENGAETVDEIARAASLPAGDVALELTRLELAGYLRVTLTGSWRRTTLAAPYAGPDGDR